MEESILQLILAEQAGDAEELRREVLERAIEYVEYRFRWELYSMAEKADNDRYRTSAHDVFMDSVNIYLRFLGRTDDSLPKQLGDDRKRNGDLACKIVYEISVKHR